MSSSIEILGIKREDDELVRVLTKLKENYAFKSYTNVYIAI